jgi:alpha-beta hydrolase superfamily lysophospholipase
MGGFMNTKLLIGLAVVLGLLLLVFGGRDIEAPEPEPEPELEGELIGAGRFVLELGEDVLLEEEYTIFYHPAEGYMVLSQGSLNVGEGPISLAQQAQFDRGFLPIFYQLAAETPSGSQIISAQMGLTGLVMEVRVGTSRQDALVEDATNLALLDNNLIAHYAVLLMAIRVGAIEREFTAAIPQGLLTVRGAYDGPTGVSFESDGVFHEGERYDLNLGGTQIVLIGIGDRLVGLVNLTQGTVAYDVDRFPGGIIVPDLAPAEPVAAEPVPSPEGILERDITFASGDLTLAGTVATPEGEGPFPGVLFLHGSGPVDRDGNAPGLKMDAYRQLAQALAGRGIASLRYDKRGTGTSDGDSATATRSDLLDDARAAIDALRALPDIDGTAVFLVGHSEGAYLAPILAAEDASLAGIALLAGAARSLDDITWWQIETMLRAAGAGDSQVAAAYEQQSQYFEFVKGSTGDWSDYTAADLMAELPWLTEAAAEQLLATPLSLPWLREHYMADTEGTLGRVKVPVFVLNGEKDSQIPYFESDAIVRILEAAGNEDVAVHVLPDLNHFLRNHPEAPSLTNRHVEDPVDPRVIDLLSAWILEIVDR